MTLKPSVITVDASPGVIGMLQAAGVLASGPRPGFDEYLQS
jgi:hypothetical protein